MKVGTKSILFGVHCFAIHPFFVAAAWIKLYGWTWNPAIWLSFFVHDLGYWGKPNMDGAEGKEHPVKGARIMLWLCDFPKEIFRIGRVLPTTPEDLFKWHDFTLYHSRYIAQRDGAEPSRLCVADKLATVITPSWLYLPLAHMSGEIEEYKEHYLYFEYGNLGHLYTVSDVEWLKAVKKHLLDWVNKNK